jgi:hypothetical protein
LYGVEGFLPSSSLYFVLWKLLWMIVKAHCPAPLAFGHSPHNLWIRVSRAPKVGEMVVISLFHWMHYQIHLLPKLVGAPPPKHYTTYCTTYFGWKSNTNLPRTLHNLFWMNIDTNLPNTLHNIFLMKINTNFPNTLHNIFLMKINKKFPNTLHNIFWIKINTNLLNTLHNIFLDEDPYKFFLLGLVKWLWLKFLLKYVKIGKPT